MTMVRDLKSSGQVRPQGGEPKLLINLDSVRVCDFEQLDFPQIWMTFSGFRCAQPATSASFTTMQIAKRNAIIFTFTMNYFVSE